MVCVSVNLYHRLCVAVQMSAARVKHWRWQQSAWDEMFDHRGLQMPQVAQGETLGLPFAAASRMTHLDIQPTSLHTTTIFVRD